ncbi:class I SAM-dependent methyltransferase [Virgibacillus soli]|uniref:Class I SAM-dependent methyltransferase n=1 Tax=Paracerasibacillus soli TaxID=480284 RepID=A0ABU5CX08_9BACI|nr:class I SAM-dependent methyltransferase [Virgibacillus soli]MDY0409975.1 class I SAM-dependent methyltransferase [Virgibacillus soli]
MKLESLANQPLSSLLELGAGSGEVVMAAAQKGYDVTAVELVPALVEKMNETAKMYSYKGTFTSICGDFYNVDFNEKFDLVYYIDGFGVGNDEDQRRLLKRINSWLVPNGCALIDIYTPWYWAKHAGQTMAFKSFSRRYDYDFSGARMLDTWWTTNEKPLTQSLRCYAPADLNMLLDGTGLKLVDVVPGGAMNYETWEYKENVPLEEAMSYMAKLVKI